MTRFFGLAQLLLCLLLIAFVPIHAICCGLFKNRPFLSRWTSICYILADDSEDLGQGFSEGFKMLGGLLP